MTEQTGPTAGAGPRFSTFARELSEFVESVIPPEEVCEHFRASRVEFWKGVRAMIDVHIDHIARAGQKKGASVVVE